MAAYSSTRQFAARVGVLIAVCTVLLTASFVGILSFVSGTVEGFDGRIPWYLIVASFAFVGSIVLLEHHDSSGRDILLTALVTATSTFVLVSLGIEGLLFAVQYPSRVFVSQLVLYLFAAGLIGTGFGYWGLKHWREFTGAGPGRL